MTCHLCFSSFSPEDLRPDSLSVWTKWPKHPGGEPEREETQHNITQHNKLLRFSADFNGVRVYVCARVCVCARTRAPTFSP